MSLSCTLVTTLEEFFHSGFSGYESRVEALVLSTSLLLLHPALL